MPIKVESDIELHTQVRHLYEEFGQRKPMGLAANETTKPHYFLLRTFRGDNDLLIILNTKRCRYQCYFCQLPQKSSKIWVPDEDVVAQVSYVLEEVRHSLSILDRITLSNEGSVLDASTLSPDVLKSIFSAVNELRRVRTVVLETRLEFVDPAALHTLQTMAPRAQINILTGFETQDEHIRDKVLYKREPLSVFLQGLDNLAQTGSRLTAYVLFKPSPQMSDDEAFVEAERSIDFLTEHTRQRGIELDIRLNPMYFAEGTRWSRTALKTPAYRPPRLTDVMKLAEKKAREGVAIYIGLSTEGLADETGTYHAREDFSPQLIRPIKLFNDRKIASFDWSVFEG